MWSVGTTRTPRVDDTNSPEGGGEEGLGRGEFWKSLENIPNLGKQIRIQIIHESLSDRLQRRIVRAPRHLEAEQVGGLFLPGERARRRDADVETRHLGPEGQRRRQRPALAGDVAHDGRRQRFRLGDEIGLVDEGDAGPGPGLGLVRQDRRVVKGHVGDAGHGRQVVGRDVEPGVEERVGGRVVGALRLGADPEIPAVLARAVARDRDLGAARPLQVPQAGTLHDGAELVRGLARVPAQHGGGAAVEVELRVEVPILPGCPVEIFLRRLGPDVGGEVHPDHGRPVEADGVDDGVDEEAEGAAAAHAPEEIRVLAW